MKLHIYETYETDGDEEIPKLIGTKEAYTLANQKMHFDRERNPITDPDILGELNGQRKLGMHKNKS